MAQAAHAFINEEETERLRSIFDKSFQESSDKDLSKGLDRNPADDSNKNSTDHADGDFDWSITLGNINLLSDSIKESNDRVAVAELRAEKAEKRSAELEQWLRRLHQAVLRGLPQKQ